MTDKVFGRVYASQYDILYADKDYEAECDLIEDVFRKYGNDKIKTVLDLGCGTGNHAIPMVRRGYRMTGVDISEEMLACARAKSQSAGSERQNFLHGDVRNIDLHKQFDAVLMMFAVLGYQTTNEDVFSALNTASRHLKPGGLFIFDVWYGPAVLMQRPTEKVKIIPTPKGKIIRTASGQLDTFRHLCEVRYKIFRIEDMRIVSESEESHLMRYFFPQELAFFLKQADLDIQQISAFNDLRQAASEKSWNILTVSRKRSLSL
jgi:SAM-dependent methyltransferase